MESVLNVKYKYKLKYIITICTIQVSGYVGAANTSTYSGTLLIFFHRGLTFMEHCVAFQNQQFIRDCTPFV